MRVRVLLLAPPYPHPIVDSLVEIFTSKATGTATAALTTHKTIPAIMALHAVDEKQPVLFLLSQD